MNELNKIELGKIEFLPNSKDVNHLPQQVHDTWVNWMTYLFNQSTENADGTVTINKDLVDRWKRQIQTDYFDLSEDEQKSDKLIADDIMNLIEGNI